MTSQRFLKLLSVMSLVATIAAIVIWRRTGEAPPPVLIKIAIATLAAALIVFVADGETRPRFMMQFLAALFAALALFAFTTDYTIAHAGSGGFHAVSLLERMNDFAPSLQASLKNWISRSLGEAAWDPILTTVLGLPAYLVFAVLALVCGFAGRPRHETPIFIN